MEKQKPVKNYFYGIIRNMLGTAKESSVPYWAKMILIYKFAPFVLKHIQTLIRLGYI